MATITFIISFVILFFLVSMKIYQRKFGEIEYLKNFYSKSDSYIDNFINELLLRYSYYKKVVKIFIFEFIPALIYEGLTKLKDYVAWKYYNAGNEFRGKRVLKPTGSVSSFLEQLGEEKK